MGRRLGQTDRLRPRRSRHFEQRREQGSCCTCSIEVEVVRHGAPHVFTQFAFVLNAEPRTEFSITVHEEWTLLCWTEQGVQQIAFVHSVLVTCKWHDIVLYD